MYISTGAAVRRNWGEFGEKDLLTFFFFLSNSDACLWSQANAEALPLACCPAHQDRPHPAQGVQLPPPAAPRPWRGPCGRTEARQRHTGMWADRAPAGRSADLTPEQAAGLQPPRGGSSPWRQPPSGHSTPRPSSPGRSRGRCSWSTDWAPPRTSTAVTSPPRGAVALFYWGGVGSPRTGGECSGPPAQGGRVYWPQWQRYR